MELLASEGSTATVLHSEAGQQGEAGIWFPDGNLLPRTCHTGTFAGGKRAVALSLELLDSAGISGLSAPLFLRGVSEILWRRSISGRKQVPERGAQSWYIFCTVGQRYICDFAGHSAITATKCPLLLQPGLYSAPVGYVYKKCTLSWCREEPLQAAGHHWVLSQFRSEGFSLGDRAGLVRWIYYAANDALSSSHTNLQQTQVLGSHRLTSSIYSIIN